jgi:hypothetical protein
MQVPVVVELLVAPCALAHFSGLAIAVAQRLLPRAAHAGFAAVASLREAWRGQHGHRKPEHKRCGQMFVHANHNRSPCSDRPHAPR